VIRLLWRAQEQAAPAAGDLQRAIEYVAEMAAWPKPACSESHIIHHVHALSRVGKKRMSRYRHHTVQVRAPTTCARSARAHPPRPFHVSTRRRFLLEEVECIGAE